MKVPGINSTIVQQLFNSSDIQGVVDIMNSCVLMATIVRDPELRSTQDNTSVSSMFVEFPATREGEAPGTLKVQGWGNLAEEMKNSYSVGDSIIIEGRLSMDLIDREGYKEKKATLVASRIYPVGSLGLNSTNSVSANSSSNSMTAPAETASNASNVVDFASTLQAQPVTSPAATATPEPSTPTADDNDNNEDWDEIPF